MGQMAASDGWLIPGQAGRVGVISRWTARVKFGWKTAADLCNGHRDAKPAGDVMRTTCVLAVTITALLAGPAPADTSQANARARAGDFDARGEVRCAQEAGQPLASCTAAVARSDGSAAVVVRFANGFARVLTFSDRRFLRGSATMSGVGTDTDWTLSGGVYAIRVDDQRFELPEALVFGD
jgi:hypothetical protein